jgi:hypothetical protein
MPAPIVLADSRACKPATPEEADDNRLKRLVVDDSRLLVLDGRAAVAVPRDANARFAVAFAAHQVRKTT